MAMRNSLKSIVPLLSASNVRNTFWQNFSASPDGKNILYMSMKVCGVSFPLGQSCRKPAYHSLLLWWLNITTMRQKCDNLLRRKHTNNCVLFCDFPVQLYENGNETFGWVFICLAASPTSNNLSTALSCSHPNYFQIINSWSTLLTICIQWALERRT